MTTQPEPLRLADAIDPFVRQSAPNHLTSKVAADEMRRLYWSDLCAIDVINQLRTQRNALLEALKLIDKEFKKNGRQHWPEAVQARAAVAKVEEAA